MSQGAPLRISRVLVWLLIALGAVLVSDLAVVRYGGLTGLERIEILAQDFRQRARIESRSGEGDRSTEVAIVFFDAEATAEWPWREPFPRSVLAGLIDALADAGAATIGLDVWLAEQNPELNAIDQGDDLLQAAIERAGNVVLVAPTEFTAAGPVLQRPDPFFVSEGTTVASADVPDAFVRLNDVALVSRSGDALVPGFALALWARSRGLDIDSLMASSLRSGTVDVAGLPPRISDLPRGWSEGTAGFDETIVPLPIDFVGPPSHLAVAGRGVEQTFPAFSAAYLTTLALFTPELFRDKIVLLGTASHDFDRFRTPMSGLRDLGAEGAVGVAVDGGAQGAEAGAGSGGGTGTGAGTGAGDGSGAPAGSDPEVGRAAYQWMYGVEVHANALQNLLDEDYLVYLTRDETVGLMAIVALLIVAVVFWAGTGWGGAATVVISGGVVLLSFWAWTGQVFLWPGSTLMTTSGGLMIPTVAPIWAGTMAYIGSAAWVGIVEGREKRFIQGAFGKYVSPDVVAQISANPGALQLGGQKRMLTILFSDLSGFTTLSERMDPQALLAHLNEYLSEMTTVVMDERGTLDKYIGDAIMAFWNAPQPLEDHADRALRAAVMMQRKMHELNARWAEAEDGGEPLVVRIGINSGEVVVGNVGGENRFDYSAIGDSVNLAARLEPANKSYDTLTMCSEFTLAQVDRDAFRLRELDLIAVKGKERPVRVYEVIELAGADLGAARERCLEAFESGLAAYKAHDWAGAAGHFQRALEADPTDGPSRVYLERAGENEADPPPADWDFVVRRTVK